MFINSTQLVAIFEGNSDQTYATMRSDSSESRLFFSWTRLIHWSIVSGSPDTKTQTSTQEVTTPTRSPYPQSLPHCHPFASLNQLTVHPGMLLKQYSRSSMQGTKSSK